MIEIKGVSKTYDGEVKVLNQIDLTIKDGEFAFLQGESGSGKSTLLKILYRDLHDFEGDIFIDGQSIRDMPKYLTRRAVATIFQTFELLPKKTALENVCLAGEVLGTNEKSIEEDAREMLRIVGLSTKENRFPHQLSYGEQQRVAIARALVNRPKILIADEPTGNLDPENALRIIHLLKEINEKHQTTMLIVTHSKDLVEKQEATFLYMKDGGIIKKADKQVNVLDRTREERGIEHEPQYA